MLKKAVQQGRSERRGEEVHTALRGGRLPLELILANGKPPPVLPTAEKPLLNVEPLSEARTKLANFFSILPGETDAGRTDDQLLYAARTLTYRNGS
jgi:hypothetical protein